MSQAEFMMSRLMTISNRFHSTILLSASLLMTALSAGCASTAVAPPRAAAGISAAPAAAPSPAAEHGAGSRAGIVARVAGEPITAEQLDAHLGNSLLPLLQQEYEQRVKALTTLAAMQLERAEAARRGIPVDELRRIEIAAKSPVPSQDDVETTLKFLRPRLPKDPAEARAAVIQALTAQKQGEREAEYHQELRRAGGVEILIEPPRWPVVLDPAQPVRGNASSAVTFVEYSDFQCPYCSRSQEMVGKLVDKYGDRVRFVFHNRPLEIHDRARFAAEAGLCANEQGKFWPLHDWMFQNPNDLRLETMKGPAEAMGIDFARLESCLASGRNASTVSREVANAEKLGVQGTPTFFINGRMMHLGNPLEEFERVIEEELASSR